MGIFNKINKVTAEAMGMALYKFARDDANFMTDALIDVTDKEVMKNKDAAFIIPILYNFCLYNIVLCEKNKDNIVNTVMYTAFDNMKKFNADNKLIYNGTFDSVYGEVIDILRQPYIDEFDNPYEAITKYYLAQVYGKEFSSGVAKLTARGLFSNWSCNCRGIFEQYRIV